MGRVNAAADGGVVVRITAGRRLQMEELFPSERLLRISFLAWLETEAENVVAVNKEKYIFFYPFFLPDIVTVCMHALYNAV